MKPQPDSPTWFLDFLSILEKSNRLEELALNLAHPHTESSVDWAFWRDTGRILAGSHFKFLRKVEIDLWPSHLEREAHAEICKNLSEVFQPVREIGIQVEI
jgi:hypothetical protein